MKVIKSNSISAFGGINFVFKYLNDLKINEIYEKELPALASQSKYSWSDILYAMKSIYFCGADYIEDLSIHLSHHFKNNPLIQMPSPDVVLRRMSELTEESCSCKTKRGVVEHQYCTNKLLESLLISILKTLGTFDAEILTVDYDNTIIFNEKRDSKMTYKRNYGYQPGVCTINENQVLYIENRNGNSDAKSFQTDTLSRMFNLLANKGIKKVNNFRADAASYQYDVVSLVEKNVDHFYIGCRNNYVEKFFKKVELWELMPNNDMEVGSIIIRPFAQQAIKSKEEAKEYRLVVKRTKREDGQIDLITQDAYEYRAILTNDFKKSIQEIVFFYNKRGQMERQFDILKNDFGWNNMPFSSLNKNLVFLYLTAIFRNIYEKIIVHFSSRIDFLEPTYRLKKFIFRFVTLPAKWIKQGRQYKLKIYTTKDYCL